MPDRIPASILDPTDHDLLLHWMSERGAGSWQQFKAAYEWLFAGVPGARSPSVVMRTLDALGHVEMAWATGRWTVAPPVLVALPLGGMYASLVGARTARIEGTLTDLDEGLDDIDAVVETVRQRAAPTAVFVGGGAWEDLEAAAHALGATFAPRFPESLARRLPPLARPKGPPQSELPDGFEWFDAGDLRWRTGTSSSLGLRQYTHFGVTSHYWNDGSGWREVDKDSGRYLELERRGRNILRFERDGVSGRLQVPMEAPLPRLQARVAATCSGIAPWTSGGLLEYLNVPLEIAGTLAQSLGQRLIDPRTLKPL